MGAGILWGSLLLCINIYFKKRKSTSIHFRLVNTKASVENNPPCFQWPSQQLKGLNEPWMISEEPHQYHKSCSVTLINVIHIHKIIVWKSDYRFWADFLRVQILVTSVNRQEEIFYKAKFLSSFFVLFLFETEFFCSLLLGTVEKLMANVSPV